MRRWEEQVWARAAPGPADTRPRLACPLRLGGIEELKFLPSSDRGFEAVVIGEPQRAFYGAQFALTFRLFRALRGRAVGARSQRRGRPRLRGPRPREDTVPRDEQGRAITDPDSRAERDGGAGGHRRVPGRPAAVRLSLECRGPSSKPREGGTRHPGPPPGARSRDPPLLLPARCRCVADAGRGQDRQPDCCRDPSSRFHPLAPSGGSIVIGAS